MKGTLSGIMLTLLLTSMLTLASNIEPVQSQGEEELLFFDDFNDGVADGWTPQRGYTWEVIDGQYVSSHGLGRSISIVDDLTFSDGVIKVTMWNRDTTFPYAFQNGIVFRYLDESHYYSFFLSDEYDEVRLRIHNESDPHYGWNITDCVSYPVNPNTAYTLEIRINGNNVTGYVNGEKVISGCDDAYEVGSVGLSVHIGEVFFDNFTLLTYPLITVPDDYPTIQEAINHANEGDTIYVKNGTYYENVVVNKTVSLVGEDRETTIIDGNGTGSVIYMVVSDAVISGFTMQNGTNGIYVSEFYGRITIHKNTIMKNANNAINLRQSSGNNITDNIINLNHIGIKMWYCGSTTISGNTLSQNEYGIELAYSRFFTFRGNIMMNNTYSLGIWSYGKPPYGSLYDFIHDIDTSNAIDGRPIYYWVSRHDEQIPEDAGCVGVINSTNITVKNLNLTNNGQGVLIAFSTNSTVQNVNVSNTMNGIRLVCSSFITVKDNALTSNNHGIFDTLCSNNTIVGNHLLNNDNFGVAIANSNGTTIAANLLQGNKYGIIIDGNPPFGSGMYNLVYHNNFVNNTYQVYPYTPIPSNNTWDNGCEGNYWSNYNGTDLDGDGIGDTYLSWEGVDYYPLMNPYWSPGDIDHDLDVDLYDAVKLLVAYGSEVGDENYNPHCDIAESYGKIDLYDAIALLTHYGQKYP